MHKLATVLLLGLGGVCLVSAVWADQVTLNPLMLNSNAASVAGVAGSQQAPQLNKGSGLPGNIGGGQAISLSVAAGLASAPQSRALGATVAESHPTAALQSGPAMYSTQMSTTLQTVGANAVADTPQRASMQVPSALQLSRIANAARTGLGGISPSDRALNK